MKTALTRRENMNTNSNEDGSSEDGGKLVGCEVES